jgi:NADPH2:quinone reductase
VQSHDAWGLKPSSLQIRIFMDERGGGDCHALAEPPGARRPSDTLEAIAHLSSGVRFPRPETAAHGLLNPTGVETLKWTEQPTPTPRPGAAGDQGRQPEFPDLLIVQNKYQIKPPCPLCRAPNTPAWCRPWAKASTLRWGQHVACLSGTGGFGTHTLARGAVHAAAGRLPLVDAAAFIMTYATSCADRPRPAQGRRDRARAGRRGRVGTAAIRLPRPPARVIAAASTDEKCALCKPIGADLTINYTVRSARSPQAHRPTARADVMYDPVGGDLPNPPSAPLPGAAATDRLCLRPHSCAAAEPAAAQGRQHRGRVLGRIFQARTQANAVMMELAQWYGQGKIKPVIDRTMPMTELPAAYAHMGSRSVQSWYW